jgi:hypothetical protein
MKKWLPRRFRQSSARSAGLRPTARLALERLEERALPSTVTYHSGPLLAHVEVEDVFYGPSWSGSPAGQQSQSQLNTFVKTLVNSPYLDQLASYSRGSYQIGRGTLSGSETNADNWPAGTTSVTELMIRTMLDTEITNGLAPQPDANRLYMVYLPANIGFVDIGHHKHFTDSAGATVYYAVIPDQSAQPGVVPQGAFSGITPFHQKTLATSHELAEAITNPDGSGGWWDSTIGDKLESDEIGDITQAMATSPGQIEGNLYGYDVQAEWIESAGANLLPSALPSWSGVGQPVAFRSITMALNQNGLRQEFALGSDGAVWARSELQGAEFLTYWGNWSSLGKPTSGSTTSLQVGHNFDGSLEVFVLGSTYNGYGFRYSVWTTTQSGPNAGTFGGWQNLGGPAAGLLSLTVASNANGYQQVFALGADYAVYTAQQYGVWNLWTNRLSLSWNPLTSLGGYVQSISVAADANKRLNVFSLGFNDAVYTMSQTSAGSSTWTGWSYLGGYVQSVSAATNADGSLEIFSLGFDDAVYTRWQLGSGGSGGWNGWVDLGGNVRSITVGANQDGRLEVFAIGQDSQVYGIQQTAVKVVSGSASAEPGEWSWWYALGGTAQSMSVGRTGDGQLELFTLDSSGNAQTATRVQASCGWA